MATTEHTPQATNDADIRAVESLGEIIESLRKSANGTVFEAQVDGLFDAWRAAQAELAKSRSAVQLARTLLTMAAGQAPVVTQIY